MSARHGTYSLLHDDDLLLCMEAVRRELRVPVRESASMFSANPPSASALIHQLAELQRELDFRLALKEAAR